MTDKLRAFIDIDFEINGTKGRISDNIDIPTKGNNFYYKTDQISTAAATLGISYYASDYIAASYMMIRNVTGLDGSGVPDNSSVTLRLGPDGTSWTIDLVLNECAIYRLYQWPYAISLLLGCISEFFVAETVSDI